VSAHRQAQFDIHPVFTQRWSPRAFTGETIDRDTLMSFFEAGRWAPSAFNAQPWRFVFGVQGTDAFGTVLAGLLPMNQVWAQKASALVVVISSTTFTPPGKDAPAPLGTHSFDAGAAWASLALQASLKGWFTHAMAGFNADALRQSLGVPDSFKIEAVVAIGKQADKSQLPEAYQARELPSGREPLVRLVAEGKFGFEG